VRNVQVRAPGEGILDDLAGRMDRVLIDAPCTGTGTWRRRPDTKWRLTPDYLAQRTAEQAALLDQARDAIVVRSLANDVVFWNRGAERIQGFRAEEIIGQPYARFFPDDAQQDGQPGRDRVYVGWRDEYRCARNQHAYAVAEHPGYGREDARINAPVPATRLPGAEVTE
jgi:PAS domain-containing protein